MGKMKTRGSPAKGTPPPRSTGRRRARGQDGDDAPQDGGEWQLQGRRGAARTTEATQRHSDPVQLDVETMEDLDHTDEQGGQQAGEQQRQTVTAEDDDGDYEDVTQEAGAGYGLSSGRQQHQQVLRRGGEQEEQEEDDQEEDEDQDKDAEQTRRRNRTSRSFGEITKTYTRAGPLPDPISTEQGDIVVVVAASGQSTGTRSEKVLRQAVVSVTLVFNSFADTFEVIWRRNDTGKENVISMEADSWLEIERTIDHFQALYPNADFTFVNQNHELSRKLRPVPGRRPDHSSYGLNYDHFHRICNLQLLAVEEKETVIRNVTELARILYVDDGKTFDKEGNMQLDEFQNVWQNSGFDFDMPDFVIDVAAIASALATKRTAEQYRVELENLQAYLGDEVDIIDVPHDGNCLPAAASRIHGDASTPASMRVRIVEQFRNLDQVLLTHIALPDTVDVFIAKMRQDAVYFDLESAQATFRYIPQLNNVEFFEFYKNPDESIQFNRVLSLNDDDNVRDGSDSLNRLLSKPQGQASIIYLPTFRHFLIVRGNRGDAVPPMTVAIPTMPPTINAIANAIITTTTTSTTTTTATVTASATTTTAANANPLPFQRRADADVIPPSLLAALSLTAVEKLRDLMSLWNNIKHTRENPTSDDQRIQLIIACLSTSIRHRMARQVPRQYAGRVADLFSEYTEKYLSIATSESTTASIIDEFIALVNSQMVIESVLSCRVGWHTYSDRTEVRRRLDLLERGDVTPLDLVIDISHGVACDNMAASIGRDMTEEEKNDRSVDKALELISNGFIGDALRELESARGQRLMVLDFAAAAEKIAQYYSTRDEVEELRALAQEFYGNEEQTKQRKEAAPIMTEEFMNRSLAEMRNSAAGTDGASAFVYTALINTPGHGQRAADALLALTNVCLRGDCHRIVGIRNMIAIEKKIGSSTDGILHDGERPRVLSIVGTMVRVAAKLFVQEVAAVVAQLAPQERGMSKSNGVSGLFVETQLTQSTGRCVLIVDVEKAFPASTRKSTAEVLIKHAPHLYPFWNMLYGDYIISYNGNANTSMILGSGQPEGEGTVGSAFAINLGLSLADVPPPENVNINAVTDDIAIDFSCDQLKEVDEWLTRWLGHAGPKFNIHISREKSRLLVVPTLLVAQSAPECVLSDDERRERAHENNGRGPCPLRVLPQLRAVRTVDVENAEPKETAYLGGFLSPMHWDLALYKKIEQAKQRAELIVDTLADEHPKQAMVLLKFVPGMMTYHARTTYPSANVIDACNAFDTAMEEHVNRIHGFPGRGFEAGNITSLRYLVREPISDGGLGIVSTTRMIKAAYIGHSVDIMRVLRQNGRADSSLLHVSNSSFEQQIKSLYLSFFGQTQESELAYQSLRGNSQKLLTIQLQKTEITREEASLPATVKAHVDELKSKFVSAAINASWSKASGGEYRAAMQYRMRLIPSNSPLTDEAPSLLCYSHGRGLIAEAVQLNDSNYTHAITCMCQTNRSVTYRHNVVRDAIARMARLAGLPTTIEPVVETLEQCEARQAQTFGYVPKPTLTRADVRINIDGLDKLVDVNVSSTNDRSMVAFEKTHTLKKQNRYKGALHGRGNLLVPIIFTSLGCPTPSAAKFIKRISSMVPDDCRRTVVDIRTGISLALTKVVGETVVRMMRKGVSVTEE